MRSVSARTNQRESRVAEAKNLTGGRVTALVPQAKRPHRFNLYIDNHFAMGLSAEVAATVRVGQELTSADLERLDRAEQYEAAREQALRYLTLRPRSEQELRRHLARKGFDDALIEAVLVRLRQVKLVDDRDFARFWVENREEWRPRSARALRYELRQKGVPEEEIQRALSQLDEPTSAYRAARAKALRWKELEPRAFREKLSAFLARRGFEHDVIRETVNRLWQEMNATSETWNPDLE